MHAFIQCVTGDRGPRTDNTCRQVTLLVNS